MILYDGIFSLHFPWNSHFCGSFLPFSLLPSGKLSHNHGNSPCSSWVDPLFLWPFSMENHHVQWVNPLFRLGHVQVRKVLNKTRGYSIIYPINPIRSHWIPLNPMLFPCCSRKHAPETIRSNDSIDFVVGRAWRMWGRKLERRTSATGEQLNESVVKLKEIRDTLCFFYSYDWNFNGYNGIYIYKIILLIITTLWKDTLW